MVEILVADDDKFAQTVITTLLTSVGAKPTVVNSGEKAIAAMKAKDAIKYKAILLD